MKHAVAGAWCRRVPGRLGALLCLALTAGGCGEFVSEDQARMTNACRYRDCVCYDNRARYLSPGKPQPVIWTTSNRPTCPPGMGLVFASQDMHIFRDQDRITQPDPLRNYRDAGPN